MFGRSYKWRIEWVGGGGWGRKPGEQARKMGGPITKELERKLPFIKPRGFPHMLVS